MMAALREWLTSVVTVTMLISVSRILVPEGTLRKVFSFTAGLILLAALLQPLIHADISKLDVRLQTYRSEIESRQAELKEEQNAMLATEVERVTKVCIEERGIELGLTLTAKVTAVPDQNGTPLPAAAELSCPYDSDLSGWMETELGIPPEKQVWGMT